MIRLSVLVEIEGSRHTPVASHAIYDWAHSIGP